MTSEIDRQTPDFLVADKFADTTQEYRDLSLSNQILLGIWREIRKTHPSQRCVIDLQFSNPLKILDSKADSVSIRFLAQGKPVQAQYLLVSNNTASTMAIGLNEVVMTNAAATFSTGVRIAAGTVFQIPVEIEKAHLTVDAAGPGLGIVVNNGQSGADIPVNGTVQIYAWTIPFSDKEDTE